MSFFNNVVDAIKLKKFANELTSMEFDQFLSKLTENHGKEIILKLLLSGFIKPASITIDHHQIILQNMIEIVSDIIQSRKCEDIEHNIAIKIDRITSSLIGEIGSWLDQTSYALLSYSNRTIFVNLNAPNRLQMLSLGNVENYSCIHLQKYPQIKSLSFRLSQFNQFEIPHNAHNETICNHLQRILLLPNTTTDSVVYMQSFINQNHINLANIQALRVGNKKNCFQLLSSRNVDRFKQLLSQFSTIQFLHLARIYLRSQADPTDRVSFPHLKQLILTNLSGNAASHFVTEILEENASNLERLWLSECSRYPLNLNSINFKNIKHFAAYRVSLNTINDVMKTAKHLEFIFFNIQYMNLEQRQSIIKKTVKEQRTLKTVQLLISVPQISDICIVLESVLFSTRKRERKYFQIIMHIQADDTQEQEGLMNTEDVVLNISKVMTQLVTSHIYSFVLNIKWMECDQKHLESIFETIQDSVQLMSTIEWVKKSNTEFTVQKLCAKKAK